MTEGSRTVRVKALAERYSYIENVLSHAFIATLSSETWRRDPFAALQVLNSEVDDSGLDLVLGLGSEIRYIQLKQAHDEKVPRHCSIRVSFSRSPGSCVVLIAHGIETLALTNFRFLGGKPSEPVNDIEALRASKAPGRRTQAGERRIRHHYRDVPVSKFQGPCSTAGLLDVLFPASASAQQPVAEDGHAQVPRHMRRDAASEPGRPTDLQVGG